MCSCENFFQTAYWLLKNPHLDLPCLEKLSTLLQKPSSIFKTHTVTSLLVISPTRQHLSEIAWWHSPACSDMQICRSFYLFMLLPRDKKSNNSSCSCRTICPHFLFSGCSERTVGVWTLLPPPSDTRPSWQKQPWAQLPLPQPQVHSAQPSVTYHRYSVFYRNIACYW